MASPHVCRDSCNLYNPKFILGLSLHPILVGVSTWLSKCVGKLEFHSPLKKKMRFGYPGSAPPERIITASNGARFIIRDYALGDPNFRRGKYPCVIYLWWQCGLFYASGRTYLLCWILWVRIKNVYMKQDWKKKLLSSTNKVCRCTYHPCWLQLWYRCRPRMHWLRTHFPSRNGYCDN